VQQVHDDLNRGLVGPVHVVEHQHQEPLRAEQRQQRAQGVVELAGLVRPRSSGL
jgi:hypothetical protein